MINKEQLDEIKKQLDRYLKDSYREKDYMLDDVAVAIIDNIGQIEKVLGRRMCSCGIKNKKTNIK